MTFDIKGECRNELAHGDVWGTPAPCCGFGSGIAHVFPQSSSALTFPPFRSWLGSAQECTCMHPHVMTALNKNWIISSVLASLMWHYDAEMLQWCGPLAPTIELCHRRPVAGRWWGGDRGWWAEDGPSWVLSQREALKEPAAAREPQGSGLSAAPAHLAPDWAV